MRKFSRSKKGFKDISPVGSRSMETSGDDLNGLTGNTKSQSKRDTQRLYWFFTWNHYGGVETGDELNEICKNECVWWVFQEEIAPTTGTPHLQGCMRLKQKRRIKELKAIFSDKIHWEKCIDVEASKLYCQKTDTAKPDGIIWKSNEKPKEFKEKPKKKELKVISTLYNWQEKLNGWLMGEPDDRKIIWIFNREGNVGKTVLCKYLMTKHRVVLATGGTCKDLACMLALHEKNNFDLNEKFTFILNIAKETDVNKISYKALESIKDGLLSSPKYESCTMVFNNPHVVVFANNMPVVSKLSKDRWAIYEIVDDELCEVNIDEIEYEKDIE